MYIGYTVAITFCSKRSTIILIAISEETVYIATNNNTLFTYYCLFHSNQLLWYEAPSYSLLKHSLDHVLDFSLIITATQHIFQINSYTVKIKMLWQHL